MIRFSPKTTGRFAFPVMLVLLCAVSAVLVSRLPFLITLEHKTVDWRMRFRVPDKSFGKDVVVVLLDEAVMEKLPYRSPVPRRMLSKLVSIIDGSGAKLIALDVFLKNTTWEDEDLSLAVAMEKSGKVVLTTALREREGRPIHDLPLKRFLDKALAVGLADLPVDPVDQRVREFQAFFPVQGGSVPALFTTLYLIAREPGWSPDKRKPWPEPGKDRLPRWLDARRRAFINYQAPPSTANPDDKVIPTYAASAVLTGLLPKQWFRDKIVLIGAGYADNTDAYRTPFYASRYHYALTPGVEIHANALATLFSGKTVRFLGTLQIFAVVFMLSLLLLAVERRFHLLVSGAVLIFLLCAYTLSAFVIFDRTDLALPVVSLHMGLIATFLVLAVYRSLTEGRQKRWIKNAFQMYLSPEFVNVLLKEPDLLFLGGDEKELTILFSDLQGFTSLSEGMSPTDLVALLNEYLDGMTRILLDHGGTLDKYEGDAIMAFWGAPVERSDHAVSAVRAALEMSRFSDALSRKFEKQGKPPIKTRIGLNTGTVVVGNIGSQRRFNYTIIGDEVNLASRLEGANKQYGTCLMISRSTYSRVQAHFRCRKLDLLRVKGKEKPVSVYEVLGFADEPLEKPFEQMLALYHKGLAAYGKRAWTEALGLFEEALARVPGDGPCLTYRQRCRHFLANPPEKDWDGVFTMTTK